MKIGASARESFDAGPAGSESAGVSLNVKGFLAIGIVLALLVFIWASYVGGGQMNTPRFETGGPVGGKYGGLNDLIAIAGDLEGDQCTGHEWRVPEWDCQKSVLTPHRYPRVSGSNMSTVIHHGWDSLMRPAPQDADWIEHPPSGVEW